MIFCTFVLNIPSTLFINFQNTLANMFSPSKDIDLTSSTDFEDLTTLALESFEYVGTELVIFSDSLLTVFTKLNQTSFKRSSLPLELN